MPVTLPLWESSLPTFSLPSEAVEMTSETVILEPLTFLPTQPLNHYQAQVVVGQNFDQDILGDIAKGWNNFVETGQIWALGIGVVIGYLLKSITSSH